MKKIDTKKLVTAVKATPKKVAKILDKNSPHILTATGLVTGAATVYIVAKKAPIVRDQLDILHQELAERDEELTKVQIMWEELKVAGPIYAPAIVTGFISAGCIVGSDRINYKRTVALATAYEISQKNLLEYKSKAKEILGEKKVEKLESEIAKDIVANNDIPKELTVDGNEVIIEDGMMLCYDKMSGRYFRSSPEIIRKAESKLNKRLLSEMYVSLNDFYDEIGIAQTSIGDQLGWNIDEIIDITFNSILAPNDVPCLVVEYLVEPRYDFTKLM